MLKRCMCKKALKSLTLAEFIFLAMEEKRQKRLENKKRKIAAYLAVAEINEAEKKKKKKLSEDHSDKDELNNHVDDIKKSSELVTKYNTNSFGDVSEKPKLEGEEYEELKKRLRERKKALSCNPLFRLKQPGHDASLGLSKRIPLFMSDIQSLLLYCLVGDRAPYQPHRWATLLKWNRLSNSLGARGCGTGRLPGSSSWAGSGGTWWTWSR